MKNINKVKKEDIKHLLETNDLAVLRGFIRIFQLQTEDEKVCEETQHHNNVGFTGRDGNFMSSVANQFVQSGTMTIGQFRPIKRRMIKYAGQLTKIANGEIKVPQFSMKIYSDWLRKK